MFIPLDMYPLYPFYFWMGLAHPFHASFNLAMATAQVGAMGPVHLGLAWQAAWLRLLAESLRCAECAGDKK
jgi:hypothetical protein